MGPNWNRQERLFFNKHVGGLIIHFVQMMIEI